MSLGKWKITEQSATGETQYVIARLENTGDTDPQVLAHSEMSVGFNVSGYSQGSISFQPAVVGVSSVITIEGTIDGSNWFEIYKFGQGTSPAVTPISPNTEYEIRWTIAVKQVRIKVSQFSTTGVSNIYTTLMAEA